jgi:hypothetical protein
MLLPLSGYVMTVLLPELAPLDPHEPRFVQLVEQAFNALWLLALRSPRWRSARRRS